MRQTDNSDNSAGDRIENSTTEIIWLVETWKRHETISCYIDRLSDMINPHQILHASFFFSKIDWHLRTIVVFSAIKDTQWRANIFRTPFYIILYLSKKKEYEISSMLNYFQYQFNYPNDMTAVTVQRTREITEKFVRVRSIWKD